MKILFICGGLEPGKNGVGDYTRMLALELKKNGHHTALLAVNDPFCTGFLEKGQGMDGREVLALRVGKGEISKTWNERAASWINWFDPDWISLQYVPYSFNSKGLPFQLTKKLVNLGKGRQWQIMFHELWVGMEKKVPLKVLLLKSIQKQLIKNMIYNLKPGVIHTQSSLYLNELETLGFKAMYLPLFSNIPKLNKSNRQKVNLKKNQKNSLVLFGSIHPKAPVQSFTKEIAEFAGKNGYRMSLTLLGRCGIEKEEWINCWESQGLEVNVLGEQSPQDISKILANSLAGISTTPLAKLEKSGAVAAMRDHGLPVICAARPWQHQYNDSIKLPHGTVVYKKGNLEKILLNLPYAQYDSSIIGIGQQFINSLHAKT